MPSGEEIDQIKEQFKVVTPIQVRYGDLDTVGHVNNASYLGYMEEARIDYFEKVLGFDKGTLEFGVVVAHISIDYKSRVLITDTLNVYTRCAKIGTTSYTFESIFVTNNNHISAVTKAILVGVNESGKSFPIPASTREKLEEFEK